MTLTAIYFRKKISQLRDIFLYIKSYLKGEIGMVDMYVALVIAGRRTCDTSNTKVRLVPSVWRTQVLADLDALGLDANGQEKS